MKKRHLRSMLTVAVTGLLAATLAGCQGAAPEPGKTTAAPASEVSADSSSTDGPAASDVFDPQLEMAEGSAGFEITDKAGSVVTFKVAHPVATVTGVKPEIAEEFAVAVAGQKDKVFEAAQAFSRLTIPECEVTCEREAASVVEHAGIYKEYGTVASTSAFTFGTRDRNPGVHSVTMNLKTGEHAELSDFMDLRDPQVLGLADSALQATENWAFCDEPVADYLAKAGAYSPTDEGVLLLWPIDGTKTAQCGVDSVTVPWPDANAPVEQPAEVPDVAEPAAGDIDGKWCPTPESPAAEGCLTVALPVVSYEDSGRVGELAPIGMENGGFQFTGVDAPFGTYYPAGVAIEIPSYYSGADLPDQDRIWNSQTGTMMLRQ